MRALALVRHAKLLKRGLLDPRAPLRTRLLVIAMIAYVLSPIDLISDFIPIIGWLLIRSRTRPVGRLATA